ncbi:hypothetical protein D9M70_592120 [compost metagenome]
MLLGGDAAEMILACGKFGLVVEDRRMAGMRDEIGKIAALRQVAGEGRCGVEDDDHRARRQLIDDAGRNLADRGIRHRENDDIRAVERLVGAHRAETQFLCQTRAAKLADLDMAHVEA